MPVLFFRMENPVSPLIKDVFKNLLHEGGYHPYAQDSFSRAACPHQTMHYPKAPGDKVYSGIAEVTATRIMGVDPGFPQKHPQDVPQAMINANIKSFADGLRLAYPDAAVRGYFIESLGKPAFYNLCDSGMDMIAENMLDMLPRILDKPPMTGKRDFRISLEHDIRHAIDGSETVLDPRSDRKNLSDKDLLETYSFIAAHPEHWAGFCLWQNIIETYSEDMNRLMMQYYKPHQTPERMNSFPDHESELVDFLPLAHTVHFTRDSIGVPTIPLFFIAAAKSLTPHHNARPGAEDYCQSITQAQRAGIFRRSFDSAFGQRLVVCPFSNAGVKWLKLDLADQTNAKDSAIMRCIQKIHDEKEGSAKLRRLCTAIEEVMEKMMIHSSPDRIHELEKQDAATARPSCPYAHRR